MEKDRERSPRGGMKRTRKKVCMFCADRAEMSVTAAFGEWTGF